MEHPRKYKLELHRNINDEWACSVLVYVPSLGYKESFSGFGETEDAAIQAALGLAKFGFTFRKVDL